MLAPVLLPVTRAVRRAFTIFELLITISIIILATVIVLPAFGKFIESSNFASAVNTVTATLGNARALAIKNNQHTAVAFLFDTELQQYTLLPLELLAENGASLSLNAPGGPAVNTYSFQPASATVPVVLPKGTLVFGLAVNTAPLAALINASSGGIQATRDWYAGEVFDDGTDIVTPWIFPRNDPRHYMSDDLDPYEEIRNGGMTNEADNALRHAQSFMIQFSPEGTVVDSYPSSGVDHYKAYIEYPDLPKSSDESAEIDLFTGEVIPYDDPLAFDPENRSNNELLSADQFSTVNPEVVLQAVVQLAIVSLPELKKVPEFRDIDPWFVRPTETTVPLDVAPVRSDFDQAAYYNWDVVNTMSDWIDQNGEIISFNRFTGNILRRSN